MLCDFQGFRGYCLLLLISSMVCLWSVYDFSSLKLVEVCFVTQEMLCLFDHSIGTLKKNVSSVIIEQSFLYTSVRDLCCSFLPHSS